jgi:mono/diheme cytochrome c family protein
VTLGLWAGLCLAGWGSALWAQEPQGADLAQRLGCFACHTRQDGPAASLDGVGARLAPRELQQAITFPRQLHPRAKMPSYAYLPPREQEALVDYLSTLK